MVTRSLATGRRAEACGQRERALVWLGAGVIALHIVDDSFVQPQPGTSATDHLAGGLVPLALLGLAAFAYPRLRAGWRAVVALLLGVFGLWGPPPRRGTTPARSAPRATTTRGCSPSRPG